ncbi:urease accessory protein UreF [Neisseriaceae bacterium PsAf]|nr:urease accessory protein UreF [Neisseriaceae bacterium PsAf]
MNTKQLFSYADLNQLGWLLHIVDPNLPIGGFNHSFGLETFVQKNIIHDAQSLYEYAQEQLQQNWVYNEGAYISLAFDSLIKEKFDDFFELNQHFGITRLSREIKEAQMKLGTRLFKIFVSEFSHPILDTIQTKKIMMYHPLVFVLFSFLFNLSKQVTLYAYYYNSLVSLINNGVKLIPLGQLQGQKIIFSIKPIIETAVRASLDPDKNLLGTTSVLTEIRCMQHENLYTRLYMS